MLIVLERQVVVAANGQVGERSAGVEKKQISTTKVLSDRSGTDRTLQHPDSGF